MILKVSQSVEKTSNDTTKGASPAKAFSYLATTPHLRASAPGWEEDAGKQTAKAGNATEGPKHNVQPMTPITTALVIHRLSADVERQKETQARSLRINADEANYTYQTMDKQGEDIKALKESIAQTQEMVGRLTVQPEVYAMETPVSKSLQFTPGKVRRTDQESP